VDDVRTLNGRGLILPCRLVPQSEDLEVQPALIRRHAKTMACIVVELYQEGCRFPSRSRRALFAPTNGSKLPTMVGAVIYARVSTKEQSENLSLPTQLRACEELAEDNGMTPSAETTCSKPLFQSLSPSGSRRFSCPR
jgi:hypothetical protein